MIQKENARKICYFIGWMITGILAAAAVFLQMHPVRLSSAAKCLLRRFGVGLYCPGCGMTRCLTHLLQFEIQDAFRCNVAIFLLSPTLLYIFTYSLYSYVRYGKVHFSKVQNILLFGCLTILILFGIVRNLPAFSFLQPV